MNHPYYIKMVYGSTNPDGRPWQEGKDDYLHFREEQQMLCNHFGRAKGGLIGITLEEFKALSAALDQKC